MSGNRIVNYEIAANILKINNTVFDLNSYTVEQPVDMRKQIGKISIENKLVSDFYDGETNQYSVIKENEDDTIVSARVQKIKQILNDLKSESKETIVKMTKTDNAFDEFVFTKFVAFVMLATRILTSVLILQKVSQATCVYKPQKQDDLVELNRKITNLEKLLQRTSSLLFTMETIQ